MDQNASGALGIIAFLISGAGAIYAAVNHKRIRMTCCGKQVDMSVDVDTTEPTAKVAPEPKPSGNCTRCGRPDHQLAECTASTHVDGYYLEWR
jgi:hypothetical protein